LLQELRSLLRDTGPFQEIGRALRRGDNLLRIDSASASSLSFVAAEIAQQEERKVLLVLPRPEEAELYAEELEGMLGGEKVCLFPSWELLPYEAHSPTLDLSATRMNALRRLLAPGPGVVIASARAIVNRLMPRHTFRSSMVSVRRGGTIDLDRWCEHLVHIGFRRAAIADEPGLFARRGGILDIYPAEREQPVRLELFGDEVESIREFDPESQRSNRILKNLTIVPQREIPLTDDVVSRIQDRGIPGEVGDLLSRGSHFDGIERYLPLYFRETETLFDYLPPDAAIILLEERETYHAASEFWEEAQKFFTGVEETEHLPSPAEAFLDAAAVEEIARGFTLLLARRSRVIERRDGVISIGAVPTPPFLGNVELFQKEIGELVGQGFTVFVLCDNQGQFDRLRELIEAYLDMIAVGIGSLRRGFILPAEKIVVFAEHEVFQRVRRRRLDFRRPRGSAIDSYLSLKPDDFVVHVRYGIGRFARVEKIDVDGVARDCVVLLYADGDRLYVPTDQMDLLQKFSGSEGVPPAIDKIGGTSWAKAKSKTEKAVRKMARELLRLHAARKAKPGFAFNADSPWQKELEDSFLYEETDHQLEACRDVKRDMELPRPMDRLICGDVGYGKTEVAVRAAFKAVMDGKQVGVLVPTTILAQQHYRTFVDRFSGFPVRTEVLSRFRKPAEVRASLADLKAGTLDVLIGTHRILSKDVQFHDLGLLVVDEEQRFGVAQKEKLKRLKEVVDVLTLTATPIPRTLHLSLAGARDMSLINTPPKNRLPIATEMIEFDREVISAAILRELDRGGQVFFVHNRVQSIASMASLVSRLVPEARIAVAHGQMSGPRLESIMSDFVERRTDILVSTMIIESGLDIPTVNTLIVNRADQFGLAQLYQLRGRVGRSNHRAYAYLLVPANKRLTENAQKRLEALTEYTELGSGYRIARKDLEIRGAGNLLGPEQHGFVATVGFEMYCKLLEEAVRECRGEPVRPGVDTKLEAELDSYLPDSYVGDPDLKVVLYRRLAATESAGDVEAIRDEVEDRFGRLPPEAVSLFALRELKILGEKCGAETIRIDNKKVRVRAVEGIRPDREKIGELVRTLAGSVSFDAADGLAVDAEVGEKEDPLDVAWAVLLALLPDDDE